MCWCDQSLRTPCCGSVSCHPPKDNNAVPADILEQSSLALWIAYTDKKQEVEVLRDMLKECGTLLTEGTQEHCDKMAHDIHLYLQEKQ